MGNFANISGWTRPMLGLWSHPGLVWTVVGQIHWVSSVIWQCHWLGFLIMWGLWLDSLDGWGHWLDYFQQDCRLHSAFEQGFRLESIIKRLTGCAWLDGVTAWGSRWYRVSGYAPHLDQGTGWDMCLTRVAVSALPSHRVTGLAAWVDWTTD